MDNSISFLRGGCEKFRHMSRAHHLLLTSSLLASLMILSLGATNGLEDTASQRYRLSRFSAENGLPESD
jgi:hypothetical protein